MEIIPVSQFKIMKMHVSRLFKLQMHMKLLGDAVVIFLREILWLLD